MGGWSQFVLLYFLVHVNVSRWVAWVVDVTTHRAPIAKGKGYGSIPMGVALTLCMSLVDL
jgi:hypothetical protein